MSREGFPGGCNPADVLYKLAHSKGIKPPVFEMISEQGPPHARTFTWSCSFFEGKYHTLAAGRSKKEAKNAVAKALIDQIDLSELPQKNKAGGGGGGKRHQGAFVGQPKRKMSEMEDGMNGGGKKGKGAKRQRQLPDFFTDGDLQPVIMPIQNPMFMGMGMGMGPMGMPPMGMMGMGMMGMGMRMPMPRMPPKMRLNKEDHMVITKHKSIYPSEEELSLLLKLADTAEKSLKRVSDRFCIKEEVVKEEDGEQKKVVKKDETEREIMGVARVGDISKGLLLKGDRAVSLVVMCSEKPTVTLLNKISSAVEKDLKELPESENKGKQKFKTSELEVFPFVEEAGFCIVLNQEEAAEPYAVNITLTCTKMREKEDKKESNGNGVEQEEDKEGIKEEQVEVKEEKEEDPMDMLNKEKCLESLAQLRRSKWFKSMATPLDSCVESIRVFKEMCRRFPIWTPLGDWAVELLVERAISSRGEPLSPCNAILRVLEAVASGILAEDGPGLRDPCERKDMDVFRHLTPQQREDITKSAQEMVRKIHFRKMHEVLGMERPLSYQERKAAKEKEKAAQEKEKEAEVKTEASVEATPEKTA